MSAGTALQYLILKRFRSKRHLELKKHGITRDRPFWCAICPKRFAAMETTTVHERSHTEKLNGCSMCPQQFGHKLNRIRAMMRRTSGPTQTTLNNRASSRTAARCAPSG